MKTASRGIRLEGQVSTRDRIGRKRGSPAGGEKQAEGRRRSLRARLRRVQTETDRTHRALDGRMGGWECGQVEVSADSLSPSGVLVRLMHGPCAECSPSRKQDVGRHRACPVLARPVANQRATRGGGDTGERKCGASLDGRWTEPHVRKLASVFRISCKFRGCPRFAKRALGPC